MAGRSILVVGAGPVGLTAAVELARRGFRPRIIDAKDGPAPVAESRALAVNVRTLQLLEAAGVSEKIIVEAQQVKELRIFDGDKPLASIGTLEIKGKYQGLATLAQGRTERLLLERLAAYDIVPEWGAALRTLREPEGRPTASLSRADGSVEEAAFDFIIGADGAHSAVRKAVGLSFAGEAFDEIFWLADYRYAGEIDASFVRAKFFNPGVIARIPVDRHTLRYVSTLRDFRDRIDHPGAVQAVPWESEFKVSFRHVEAMARGNVFLIGDAAHIHSPIGGRGMNLGIEDACWLAWLIAERREQEFSGLRLPVARMVLKGTHRITRVVLMRNPIALALRNVLVPVVTSLPWIRREILTGALGLDTPTPPWLT